MKFPKTIKGYILLMRKIERELFPSFLKGFDELSKEDQELLRNLDVNISNDINEVAAYHITAPYVGSVDESFYKKENK